VNSNDLASLIPLLVIALAFWLLILRPARNRQRAAQTLQQQLAVGATVMLTSGIYGEVVAITDEALHLRIAPQTTVRVHRNAVTRIVTAEEAARLRDDPVVDAGETTRPTD